MPLVNREEIRRRKEKNARLAREQKRQQIAEKQKNNFYRKELKQKPPAKKTRSGENEKQRETGNFLNKAILIVLVLLVLTMLAVFFI